MSKIFSGKFEKLDNERRREMMPPEKILITTGIKEGDEIIDFGCGIGYFSIPAAEIVTKDGHVYAVDLSDEMLDELEKRKSEKNIKNIELINSDKIPSTILADKILLVNVLHEVDDKNGFLKTCKAALKNAGSIIIIDFQKKDTGYGPAIEHRISKEELISDLEGLGFRTEELPIYEDFYLIKTY